MTTARCRTLSSSVGIPRGRVSFPVPFGMCTRRTGGARYVPDLARSSSDCRLSTQVQPVVLGRLSVHARSPVLAGPVVSLEQPGEVQVVVERSESHLRRLLRQLRYPLLFR